MLDDIVENIIERSKESVPQNDCDYIKDGLLYCGKCNTPKQLVVTIGGQIKKPYRLCDCERAKLRKEQQKAEEREKAIKIESMRKRGFAETKMQDWTFANDDRKNEKVSKIAKRYCEKFPEMLKNGKGLLFFGTVGTGKTYLSACIVNELISRGYPCLMTNLSKLTNTMQSDFEHRQAYIDGLNDYSLLVIDDMGAERNTEYMKETVHSIIDCRYRAGLPLIVTTNLTAEELKNPQGTDKQRAISRLYEMCFFVEVSGKDRRREKLKADTKLFNDLMEEEK